MVSIFEETKEDTGWPTGIMNTRMEDEVNRGKWTVSINYVSEVTHCLQNALNSLLQNQGFFIIGSGGGQI